MSQQIVNCTPNPVSNFNTIRSFGYNSDRELYE